MKRKELTLPLFDSGDESLSHEISETFGRKSHRIVYARGFPYGAPLAILRGGATKDPDVKNFIKAEGFRWDGQRHGWAHYLNRPEFGTILKTLRDRFGCEIVPKTGMDPNYTIDLEA